MVPTEALACVRVCVYIVSGDRKGKMETLATEDRFDQLIKKLIPGCATSVICRYSSSGPRHPVLEPFRTTDYTDAWSCTNQP